MAVEKVRKRMGRPPLPLEVRLRFWEALRAGAGVPAAAQAAGVSRGAGRKWLIEVGGVIPTLSTPTRNALSFADRCRIQELTLESKWGPARVARAMGRPVSTITRELARGRDHHGRYLAIAAQARVEANRRRPKARKVDLHPPLRAELVEKLGNRHSPEQIAGRLRVDHPDDPRMWVAVETIYQAMYVQGRGSLAAEVGKALRSGRTRRHPRRGQRTPRSGRGQIPGMISISERPAEVEDRAVPGHWEGDLILGAGNASAVGTLVERSTGFVVLLHLDGDHKAATVAQAMQDAVPRIPEIMWRSLTWDRGSEMALHTAITAATGIPIYFCDPHSPWQRGTNENTNGLLRQYLPKGSDLSVHGPGILDNIATELNARPRKRLKWATPAEALDAFLTEHQPGREHLQPRVASAP